MADLRVVEGLCEIIELQAKLIHQLTIELENANGISEVASKMVSEISEKKETILG